MASKMQQRRATAAEWAAANPILADGEIGFERDTKIIKVGDGVTRWNALGMPNVVDGIPRTLVDAKGDILIGTADNTPARLGVGAEGQVLTAKPSAAEGVGWSPVADSGYFGGTSFTVPANTTTNFIRRHALNKKATTGLYAFGTPDSRGVLGLLGQTIDQGKSIQSDTGVGGKFTTNNINALFLNNSTQRTALWGVYLDTTTNEVCVAFRNYSNVNDSDTYYYLNWIVF